MTRIDDMRRMRFEEGRTLEYIGQEFGISRERVRQLLGNTGKFFRREWTEKYLKSHKYPQTNYIELKNGFLPGLKRVWRESWGQYRHPARSGSAQLGQDFEEWASLIMKENGIENKLMPNRYPFNILTEKGFRVEVKSSHVDAGDMPSQHSMSPTWCFPHLKSGRDCDFFFLCVIDQEELDGYTYFVIPAWEFYGSREDRVIRIPWPQKGYKSSKWHKYHQRLDLLK